MNWHPITEHISNATGQVFKITSVLQVAGGDINSAFQLRGRQNAYFVKLNKAALVSMFEAEWAGLKEMADTRTVTVPEPIVCGKTDQHAFLVLQYIRFGPGGKVSDRRLGEQLATLHKVWQPYYGWFRDNTIGCTPQINTRSDSWANFWRTHRLAVQLNLAASRGYSGALQSLGERLCNDVDFFFDTYTPKPSLLHGDLWDGNAASDEQGQPVLFDPACYYGDREADIAMTELFGGFGRDFYASYNAVWPLDEGYQVRKKLYNVYHVLNHLNLFGGSYLKQAETMMSQLIAEIR